MFHPADDRAAEHILAKRRVAGMANPASWEDYLEWCGYEVERGPVIAHPLSWRWGQPIIRGTIAVPVRKKAWWSSKRVGTRSKEALVNEAVAFFRKPLDERNELRKEDECPKTPH